MARSQGGGHEADSGDDGGGGVGGVRDNWWSGWVKGKQMV